MEVQEKVPLKKTTKRRFEETANISSPNVSEMLEREQLSGEEALGVDYSHMETLSLTDENSAMENPMLEIDIAARRLQIKTCMQDINLGLIQKVKRRDDLLRSIARAKEELKESKLRTVEMRAKNEEISLMIAAEDKEAATFYDNLRNEMDTLKFFESQVMSARDQVQKLKREANKTRMKHVDNKKLNTEGLAELEKTKQEFEAQLEAKKGECLALQEKAKSLGDPEAIYATLLCKRAQISSMKRDSKTRAVNKEVQLERLRQEEHRRDQVKAKHDALVHEQRKLTISHEEKMKLYSSELDSKQVALENEGRQREHKEKMLDIDKGRLEQMKNNLAAHETELGGMKSTADLSVERYDQLRVEVANLIAQQEELTENSTAKQAELDQTRDNLDRQQTLEQEKHAEWEKARGKIESLKLNLVKEETRKSDLEHGIVQKEKEGESNLQDAMNRMKIQCDNDLAALDKEWGQAEADMESKIQEMQDKTVKIQEEHEAHMLNHTMEMEKLRKQHVAITEQLSGAQNQMNTLVNKERELVAHLNETKQKADKEIEALKTQVREQRAKMESEKNERAAEVEALQVRQLEMEQKSKDAEQKLETVLKEKADSGATLKQISERLEQLRVHEKIQNEKVEKTKEELNARKQREAEAIAEMEVIRQEIAQAHAHCKTITAQVEPVSSKNERVVKQVQELRDEIAAMETESTEAQGRMENLDVTLKNKKKKHNALLEETKRELGRQLREIEDEKEEDYAKHQRNYEKLTVQQENAKKALNDSTDELKALRAEKTKQVEIVQALLNDKEKWDKEYKKVQENMAKMQKELMNFKDMK